MNVIWHSHESMQDVVSEGTGVVADGFHDHVRDGRLAEVDRSMAGFVQQPIHGAKTRPEWTASVGKARLGGRLSSRRHVRKTGWSIS